LRDQYSYNTEIQYNTRYSQKGWSTHQSWRPIVVHISYNF